MGISILAWLSSLDPYSWANMGRGMITMPMWKCLFINLYLYNYIQYHYMVKPRILLFKSLVKRNCTQNGRESKITNFFVFVLTNNQSLTGTGLWSGQTAQHYIDYEIRTKTDWITVTKCIIVCPSGGTGVHVDCLFSYRYKNQTQHVHGVCLIIYKSYRIIKL